jgi:hypothetical protein
LLSLFEGVSYRKLQLLYLPLPISDLSQYLPDLGHLHHLCELADPAMLPPKLQELRLQSGYLLLELLDPLVSLMSPEEVRIQRLVDLALLVHTQRERRLHQCRESLERVSHLVGQEGVRLLQRALRVRGKRDEDKGVWGKKSLLGL